MQYDFVPQAEEANQFTMDVIYEKKVPGRSHRRAYD